MRTFSKIRSDLKSTERFRIGMDSWEVVDCGSWGMLRKEGMILCPTHRPRNIGAGCTGQVF